MGMFIEIFYSPYQDEVLQISLIKKINALKPGIEHAKYYSQKLFWFELEPADYTLEFLLYRQAKPEANYTERISF